MLLIDTTHRLAQGRAIELLEPGAGRIAGFNGYPGGALVEYDVGLDGFHEGAGKDLFAGTLSDAEVLPRRVIGHPAYELQVLCLRVSRQGSVQREQRRVVKPR